MSEQELADPVPGPLFRPSKRRRIARIRKDDDNDDSVEADNRRMPVANSTPLSAAHDGSTPDVHATEDATHVEVPVRQRKPIGSKRGGIAFSTSAVQRDDAPTIQTQTQALVPTQNAVETATGRFMAPTGLVVTADNKHMMAYIDSKLADIRSRNTSDTATPDPPAIPATSATQSGQPSHLTKYTPEQSEPSSSHTPSASRSHSLIQPRPKPPRLGRDGKPLRPRKDRNRRTSNDMARDAMVEAVLRESRLDIYEEQPVRQATTTGGQDADADERMAAEFRRDFMAAQEERNTRRPAPPPAAKGDPVKGPKLGGSRSQRAAMHAMQEQAKNKK